MQQPIEQPNTIQDSENAMISLGLIALSVIGLHLVTANWLTHPLVTPPEVIARPIEVQLLPPPPKPPVVEPIKPKVVIKPVIKPQLPKPKVAPKPAVKPTAKPAPAPIVKAKPMPVSKPPAKPVVTAKPVETVAPVIETPSPAPSRTAISQSTVSVAKTPAQVASVSAPSKPATTAPSHHQDTGGGPSNEVAPIERPKPLYPSRAVSRHIEGKVTVEFTVTAEGEVTNPVIVSADPPEVFDDAVLQAIRRWKFRPKIVNGHPVSRHATQTFPFNLKNE